jgi:geranylgeranyl diphosphate synthase type I
VANGDGNAVEATVPYAVSLEILHNFTLIHEDVEDGNTERNGRPSVWWTWGPAQAINAGDGMHAMARMSLFELVESGEPIEKISEAVRALDLATVSICEGEYVDITMQEQITLSVDRYLKMVDERSGSLFGASALVAAIALDMPEQSEALSRFGRISGAARQIAADYVLFWGGEDRDAVQHGRLLTKKKSLPVVHAIATASPTLKRRLGDIYVQRVIDPAKVGEITEILDEAGSKEFTLEVIERLLTEAADSLAGTGLDGETKDRLVNTAFALAGRDISNSASTGNGTAPRKAPGDDI